MQGLIVLCSSVTHMGFVTVHQSKNEGTDDDDDVNVNDDDDE
jgi:hypothetical protein